MKKAFHVICCAAGSGMIGFFANQLNTVVGCVFHLWCCLACWFNHSGVQTG
ncbi:MAG: hypothetical protein IKB87_05160 [Clostridia bacterium]|nr:hypothetical protein [Clostridia bacterium]